MTDFDRLRDLPALPPEPGQAEAALRMVHRRRRRSATRSVSAAGALAVVATVLTFRGPSTTLLEQTDEGVNKTATAAPSANGHGGEVGSTTGPRLATGSAGTTEAPPSSTVRPSPTATGLTPASRPSPADEGPPPRPRQPVRREVQDAVTDRIEGPSPCTPGPGSGAWCGGALPEYVSDGEILLRVSICSGHQGFELTFDSTREVDAVVRTREGDEVWRWGRGQRFAPERHTIVLDTEECVNWRVPWDYRDDYGRRPAPGSYLAELPIFTTDGDKAFATWFTID